MSWEKYIWNFYVIQNNRKGQGFLYRRLIVTNNLRKLNGENKKPNKTRFSLTHLFFCHSGTPCITDMHIRLRVHVYGKSDSHACTRPVSGSRTIHHASMRFPSSPHWTTLSTKVNLPLPLSLLIFSLFLSLALYSPSVFF